MTKSRVFKRLVSTALCLAMILSLVPGGLFPANAAPVIPDIVTDPGTAANWEAIMGSSKDGARYAGRVWVDKSVYKHGDIVTLNHKGNNDSTFTVNVDEANGEYFQVVFSALGSSMSTNTTITGTRPIDVVLVLDSSGSMRTYSGGRTRMDHMIDAANELLGDLLTLGDVRVAIVSFNEDSETILALNKYTDGINLSVNSNGVITARNNSNNVLGSDSGYQSGTNLQDGIHRGMNILWEAQNTSGRTPIAIVLADGRANHAVNDDWYAPSYAHRQDNGDDSATMLSTLLNAAYGKTRVEKNYGTDMKVYGIGIDLSSSSNDYIYLNPGAAGQDGFNASNTDNDVRDAWDAFVTWRTGNTATIQAGSGYWGTTWTFDHNWPASAGVSTAEIAANINYVDDYQNVSGANLGSAFDEIYEELKTVAFNPISDTKNGATGVENTPLIYADNIGKYMEVKNVQAVQVFGNTYNVTKNTDGTYSVAAGTGVNQTTNEAWSTTRDIKIEVLENADGTQQLRVHINQEILPILLDKITVNTVNNVTTRTLEETEYPPLRIYYTVGIDNDVLLSDGSVDTTKIDASYVNADGTVNFYANDFGKMNTADIDGDGKVDLGDAHVGFVPSHANRFYYYQAHQEIFISATTKNGGDINWDDDLYGVVWDDDLYELEEMTYANYATIPDSQRVYTYVTFNRPVAGGSGNAAEEVTYLVYTTWGDLKESVTFYDRQNGGFLNSGSAIDLSAVGSVVSAYKNGKNIADSDLIAVLGLQSRRVSRLHNMFEYKGGGKAEANPTQNLTGTAELAYAPAYNEGAHDASDVHEHSEVIVWLGNNGRLTLPAATGLRVTKNLAEVAQGSAANEKFEINITLDTDLNDVNTLYNNLSISDGNGNSVDVNATNVGGDLQITAKLANGESVYILGLPAGLSYTVTETHDKYNATYTGATATEAGKIVSGVVTNEPVKPGGLYITKEVVSSIDGAAFPRDYNFKFEVTFEDASGAPIANTTFQLENNHEPSLTALTTDANGVMEGDLKHGETVYIKDIPAGTKVTVEEVNVPSGYTATYSSINFSGDTAADDDGEVTINAGMNATVVVTNKYTPVSTSVAVSIQGTKEFDAIGMNVDSTFTFKLQRFDGNNWVDVGVDTVTVPANTNATGNAAMPFDHYFEMYSSQPGVYSYRVIEDRTAPGYNSDITYDRSVYTFSVNVTVGSDGNLVAEVVGYNTGDNFKVEPTVGATKPNSYTVSTKFTNYYHKTATSVAIKKTVSDLANAGKTAAGFVIETYEADANWNLGSFIRSDVTDAKGEAMLVRNYDNTDFAAGETTKTYYFIIKEKAGTVGTAGWQYDPTEYRVTVNLTKDANEAISADFDVVRVNADGTTTDLNVNGNTAEITFNNTYSLGEVQFPADTTPLVNKTLTGRGMTAGEFNFAIFENGDRTNMLAEGTNDAYGNVTFNKKLTFTRVGRYYFDVVEIPGNNAGMTYDPTIYDLVVEVTDNGDGTLSATHFFEDSVAPSVTFKNTYTVSPIDVVISGSKSLSVINGSRALSAGEFKFGLFDAAGNKIDDTTNLANGAFSFAAITYDTDDIGKTYTYTVKEIDPNGSTDGSYSANGVTWSGQSFTVTVKIVDKGNGVIEAEVSGNGAENIAFVNTYESKPVSVSLSGTKVLEGRTLTAGEFKFALYKTDSASENRSLVSSDITHDVNGKFTVDLGTLYEGYHYFVLTEVVPDSPAAGIHYSGAEYHVSVRVFDNGVGQMDYALSVSNPGDPNATGIVFTNLYSPASTEIVLSGTKTYEGGVALEDDVFSVGLYYQGSLIDTALVKADGSFTFNNLFFGASNIGNSYDFTVKEIIPAGATDNGDGTKTSGNIVYDASEYTVTVTVNDDVKDGVLEITKTVTKNNSTVNGIEFTNTFVPSPIDYTISASKSYDKGLKGNDFEFTLVSADGKTNVNQTKSNDASGAVTFDPVTFESEGDYKFKLTEKKDGILGFIRPSDAEYEITVTVVKENGVLRVSNAVSVNTKNTGESGLEFENVYLLDGEGEITLGGTKKLTGDRTKVEAGEFEFGLYDSEGKLVEAVKNGADGKFVFNALKFDETGVPVNGQKQYTYTVKEIAGDNARYTYDSTVYTVVVTVKDNDEGGIEVSYTVNGAADTAIEFTNTYKNPAPVTYKPVAEKSYNKPLKGDDFKFTLEGEILGTKVSQEKTNSADGKIVFDELSFPEAGEYTFEVKEIGKILGFINYSKAEYELVVEVIDTKGVLSIGSVTVNDDPDGTIEFVNTYFVSGSSEITVSGEKTLTGRELKENEFEFKLTEVDAEGKEAANGKVLTAQNGKDGKFSFELSYGAEDIGTHYYRITEVKGEAYGVTYDDAAYTVKVVVSDDEQGGIKTEMSVDGNKTIAFANTYKAETVLPINVKKTVKNLGSETIGPEGFEFILENKTTGLKANMKTDENGLAAVYLGYNEGDIGKTYSYTLREIKGDAEHVTYSETVHNITVSVSVGADGKLVAATTVNGAAADSVTCDFENVYDHTPDVPSTGVNLRIGLWAMMMVVSALGFVGLVVLKKRDR